MKHTTDRLLSVRGALVALTALSLGVAGCASSGKSAPSRSYGPRVTAVHGAPARLDSSRVRVESVRPASAASPAAPARYSAGAAEAASRSDDSAGARPAPPMAKRRMAKDSVAPITVAPGRSAPPVVTTPAPVPAPRVNLLTAASVGDHDRFTNYMSYLTRHNRERSATGLVMDRRVRLRVVDGQNKPINDAAITITAPNQRRFFGRTHADGRWDFFPSFAGVQTSGAVEVTVSAGTRAAKVRVGLPRRGTTQEIQIKLPNTRALSPRALDLAFAIDITGSMSDELRYVNNEIADIVRRVKASVPNTAVRVGAVFYKDRMDHQRLQMLRFTNDVAGFGNAMRRIRAGGGGDYPEDMNAGLQLAMKSLRWSTGNAVRVLVVLADAPPKYYSDANYRYRQAMADASKRGIRLLPVAASGANRTVEYLFRAMGAMTSTPYVYLTDDSGVGGKHMEADTDRVGVEKFNNLLTRLIVSDLRGQGMHEPGHLGVQ